MDVLFPSCAGKREYSKLPTVAKNFIQEIEGETGVPVVLIGTGEDVFDIIDRRSSDN
jgi:adenylosuccinate synthase